MSGEASGAARSGTAVRIGRHGIRATASRITDAHAVECAAAVARDL